MLDSSLPVMLPIADWVDETLITNVVADESKRHGLYHQFYASNQ